MLNIARYADGAVWMIQPSALCAMLDVIYRGETRAIAKTSRTPGRKGDIAILPVHGPLANRSNWVVELFGGTGYDSIRTEYDRLMADESVSAVVMDFDSPGGDAMGATELARHMRDTKRKPLVAVANHMMDSAAYYLGAQADEIVASPSADVGSIGTVAVHLDTSAANESDGYRYTVIAAGEHKWEDSGLTPLSDDAREHLQRRVNDYYGMFVADVAKGRGVTTKAVLDGYGQGRSFGADEAKARGMVDRVDTLDNTIARLATKARIARAK